MNFIVCYPLLGEILSLIIGYCCFNPRGENPNGYCWRIWRENCKLGG